MAAMASPSGTAALVAQASDVAISMNDYMRDVRLLLIGGLIGALLAWLSSRWSSGNRAKDSVAEPADDCSAGSSSWQESKDQVNTLLGRSESKVSSTKSLNACCTSKDEDDDHDDFGEEEEDEHGRDSTFSKIESYPGARRKSTPEKKEASSYHDEQPKVRRNSTGPRIRTEVTSMEDDPVSKVHDLCFALRSGDETIRLNSSHLDLIEKAMRFSREHTRRETHLQQLKKRLTMHFSCHSQSRFWSATCASPAGANQEDEDKMHAQEPASSSSRQGKRVLQKVRTRLRVILPLRRGMMEHRKKVRAKQREIEIARIQEARSAIFEACQLSSTICDTVSTSVASMHLWNDFDIFKLCLLIPKPMPLITHCALRGTGLVDLLGGVLSEMQQVFTLWSDMYNENNPFHTSLHAADVTQAVYHALTSVGLMDRIPSLRALAMLLSAAVHDIGHPGVNNAFLVASGDELALRYNDRSVLENMHVATAFLLVHESRIDFWGKLGPEGAQVVRKDMIVNILGTDMAEHAHCVANVQRISETIPDWSDKDTQALVCKAMVHAADISNPARPWDLYWSWTDKVMEEFFMQSDLEKQHGLKFPGGLSFLSRRTPMNVQQFQLGFIKAVILPFNVGLGNIKDLDHSDRLTELHLNIDRLTRESAARQEELQQLENDKK